MKGKSIEKVANASLQLWMVFGIDIVHESMIGNG